jgi:hypothetical protein
LPALESVLAVTDTVEDKEGKRLLASLHLASEVNSFFVEKVPLGSPSVARPQYTSSKLTSFLRFWDAVSHILLQMAPSFNWPDLLTYHADFI